MARSRGSYVVKIHYPEDMSEIRKKMGAVYTQFVRDYILTLPISDEEKNKLYQKVFNYFLKK